MITSIFFSFLNKHYSGGWWLVAGWCCCHRGLNPAEYLFNYSHLGGATVKGNVTLLCHYQLL